MYEHAARGSIKLVHVAPELEKIEKHWLNDDMT
jgi:hypothetical protein